MQAELYHDDLGTLILGTDPYVVANLQIGSPAVRENLKARALSDGVNDNTRYLGSRAITATLRLKSLTHCDGPPMQDLLDRVTPYMHPRRRPTLTWQLYGSDTPRAAIVRGVTWPYTIDGPKYPTIALSWIVPSGQIVEGGPDARHCVTIQPAGEIETGRTYDLVPDRHYADQGPIGTRYVFNEGTDWAHWDLTIHGPVVNPRFIINGIEIRFDRNGGLTLGEGEYVVLDTRARTVLLDGNDSESRYGNMNYDEWNWDQVRLKPGQNQVRFTGDNLTTQSTAVLCWTGSFA